MSRSGNLSTSSRGVDHNQIDSEIYLDNNATMQPLPEVGQAMAEVLGDQFGNASSAHTGGDRARKYLSVARDQLGAILGAEPDQIVFTSSGTESNNMVLCPLLASSDQCRRVVTTAVEHSSILKVCENLSAHKVEVEYLPVDQDGHVSLDAIDATITPQTSLVSVQWVNNETGVIQPVEAIGEICRKHQVLFHTDAAQAVGKVPINLSSLPIDLLSLTGHKFGGPPGVGVLYAQDRHSLQPLLFGGPQEDGMRAGTENIPGIVGLGKAAEVRMGHWDLVQSHIARLRNHFEQQVIKTIPQVTVNGDQNQRVDNTTNLLFKGVDGQALVAQLDLVNIRCSQSSACTNQRPEPSYVLRGMGLSEEEAYASVRFGFSEYNTIKQVGVVINHLASICKALKGFRERSCVAV